MPLMPVAEALRQVLAGAEPLTTETVALDDAFGRVLATDIAARRTQPPADVSAMDGYAVRAEDTFGAGRYEPRTLRRMFLPLRPERLTTTRFPSRSVTS